MKLGFDKRRKTPSFAPRKPKKTFLEIFLIVTGVIQGIQCVIDAVTSIKQFLSKFF